MVKYILKKFIILARNFLLLNAGVSETAYPEKWGNWRNFIFRILGVGSTTSFLLAEPHHFEQAGVKNHILRIIPTDPAEGPVHVNNPVDAADTLTYFWFPRLSYELSKAVFDPLTGLVLLNSVVVIESSFRFPKPELYDLNVIRRCKNPIQLDVLVCSGINSAFNYHHWLTEGLISILRIRKQFGVHIPFITPKNLTRYQKEAMDILDVKRIEVDGPVRCSRFLLAGQHQRSQAAPRPSDISLLRNAFIPLVAGPDSNQGKVKIYISRRNSSRSVIQEKELEQMLEDKGFLIIFTENLSFREEINLFTRATIVVGATGSGLGNSLWMSSGAQVIEIKYTGFNDPSAQYTSPLLGIHYKVADCRDQAFETPAKVVMEKIIECVNENLINPFS